MSEKVLNEHHDALPLDGLVDVRWAEVATLLRDAMKQVSNAYGCFAGCTAALPGGGERSHSPACSLARDALARFDSLSVREPVGGKREHG